MRTITLPAKVRHFQHLSNAACRKLPRCRSCGRVLRVFDHAPDICHECVMLERARAAAERDPKTRRCEVCGAILTSVFADSVCVKCAGVRNVKGGGK